MSTRRSYSGCGDQKCWCAEAKVMVIDADVKNLASPKQTDPFHRGWWLKNHPELYVDEGKTV